MVAGPQRKRRILVTGGAGFIGSHTVDHFLRSGHQVIVLDDFSTGKRSNLAQWDKEERLVIVEAGVSGDIGAALGSTVKSEGPIDNIVHLAAQTSVVRSIEEPLFDAKVNHSGTAGVFEYARREKVEKVVFASSSAVYGEVETLPVSETAIPRPLSPYGIHKRSGELLAAYYGAVHGLSITCFRFFNVYGPRQDPKSPYSGVISIFADRASAGKTLVIFGDGEQTRDFVYVEDIAKTLATTCFTEAGNGMIVNLGTGIETTVNELATAVINISATAEQRSEISHEAARAGEIRKSVADIKLASKELGFRPKVKLLDGLKRTFDSSAT